MSIQPGHSISRWTVQHKPTLALSGALGITRFSSNIVYGLLPIMVAFSYHEWLSGIFLGFWNLAQALLGDPIAGNLSDRLGSKKVVIIGTTLVGAAGIFWLFVPLTTFAALSVFAFCIFTSFSFRDESYAYLLRMSKRVEGGIIFGVAENVYAVATLLSTLAIPYFIATAHHQFAALLLIGCSLLSLIILIRLPEDSYRRRRTNPLIQLLSPWNAIREGWHFVRMNNFFPLLAIGASLFEGVFYGTVWFVIPLQIAVGSQNVSEGLELGIYELVTIFIASFAGYLSDHYSWRKIHQWGWLLTILGAVLLPLSSSMFWLIAIGAIVAVGNNFFAFAAGHALEQYDIDHSEDGVFIGLNNLVTDLGYSVGPVAAGILYYSAGFTASIAFASITTVGIGTFMLLLAGTKHSSERKNLLH